MATIAYTKVDTALVEEVNALTAQYLRLLEAVQIRDALKAVMKIASAGNKYLQTNTPWVLVKSANTGDRQRASLVMSLTIHLIRWLAILLEPYMPTVADKIYTQLNIQVPEAVLREPTIAAGTAPTADTAAATTTGASLSLSAVADTVVQTAVKWDLNAFDEGHTIGNPIPIFRELQHKEIETLKAQFAGKQDGNELQLPLSIPIETLDSKV